jgi:hypothetical protein
MTARAAAKVTNGSGLRARPAGRSLLVATPGHVEIGPGVAPPSLREPRAVRRTAILEHLDRGSHAILLIKAPPGYGIVTGPTPVGCTTRGTIRGMNKTTLYLPGDLKAAVERQARARGIAEAQVIREAIAAAVVRPAPRAGLIESREPIASRVDELMDGFGER